MNNDHARIAKDTIGNYYLGGWFASTAFGQDTVAGVNVFVKLNEAGEPVWARNPEETGNVHCTGYSTAPAPFVAAHPSGTAVFVVGEICGDFLFGSHAISEHGNGTQLFLARYDPNGDCAWVKTFGGSQDDHVGRFESTPSGDLLLTYAGSAMTVDGIAVQAGESILKFDSAGTCQWAAALPPYTEGGSFYFSPVEDGIYLTGRAAVGFSGPLVLDTVSVDVSTKKFVVSKYNYDGHALWGKSHGENMIQGVGVYASSANASGALIVGRLESDSLAFGSDTIYAPDQMFLVRYDANGNYIWSRTTASNFGDWLFPFQIVMGSLGDEYILGELESTPPDPTLEIAGCTAVFSQYPHDGVFVIHLDGDGNCIQLFNQRTNSYLGPTPAANRWSIVLDTNEQPVICGQFLGTVAFTSTTLSTSGNEYDVYVGKLDALTGVNDPRAPEGHDLLIYANPNQGSFRIKVPTALQNERDLVLSVYDNSGRLVRAQQLDMSGEDPRMDVFGVGPGLYTVTLSKDDRIYHGSMVVE